VPRLCGFVSRSPFLKSLPSRLGPPFSSAGQYFVDSVAKRLLAEGFLTPGFDSLSTQVNILRRSFGVFLNRAGAHQRGNF
jgi:hypothetical protein